MRFQEKALIIFARYPRAGEVKTRLGAEIGMERAAEIYRQLAKHTFGLARELAGEDVRLCVFYEPSAGAQEMQSWIGEGFELYPQSGENLGVRMRNAFGKMFEAGALRCVITGTDIPDLDAAILREGFQKLEQVSVVIGPSTDGGYYLLGIQKGVGDLFDDVHWSSPLVLRETLEKVSTMKLTCSLLKELRDIDTKEDWEQSRTRP